jgi:GTPase SAR1 family protein
VFAAIDRWLGESDERRLLITGAAGTGKSTLAARLVELSRREQPADRWARLRLGVPAAVHFCGARVDQSP